MSHGNVAFCLPAWCLSTGDREGLSPRQGLLHRENQGLVGAVAHQETDARRGEEEGEVR